jgi:hypothetical protein
MMPPMDQSLKFSTIDYVGQVITLTDGRWSHVHKRHKEVTVEAIRLTVESRYPPQLSGTIL